MQSLRAFAAPIGRAPGQHVVSKPVARVQRCRAAADAGFNEDPHEVLGVPKDAKSGRVDAAYRSKRRVAEMAQDSAELARIEAAHSKIFMSSLTSRISGDGPVDKNVKNADRQRLFPWRPRYWPIENKSMAVGAAIYTAIILQQCFLTMTPEGVVPTATAAFFMNTYKQYQLDPVTTEDRQKKMAQGWKHVFRGFLLAILGTALGIFAFVSTPDYVASALNIVLPVWFYECQAILLTVGSALVNFITFSFYR